MKSLASILWVVLALPTAGVAAQADPEDAAAHRAWLANSADARAERRQRIAARRSALRRIDAIGQRSRVHWLDGHAATMFRVRSAPDGRQLVTWGEDGRVILWKWTGEYLATLGRHTNLMRGTRVAADQAARLQFSPDGDWVLVVDRLAGEATVYDGRSAERVGRIGGETFVVDAVFDAPSRGVAFVDDEGAIRRWDVATGRTRSVAPAPAPDAQGAATTTALAFTAMRENIDDLRVAWQPRGTRVLAVSGLRARVLDTATGAVVTLGGPDVGHSVTHAWFAKDGERIVTTGYHEEHRVGIWSLDGELLFSKWSRLRTQRDPWSFVGTVSDDATRLVAAGRDADDGALRFRVWDVDADRAVVLHTIAEPTRREALDTFVAISPDGRFAAAGFTDSRVFLWDAETGATLLSRTFGDAGPSRRAPIRRVLFTSDSGRLLALGSPLGSRVLHVSTSAPSEAGVLNHEQGSLYDLCVSPDDRLWQWAAVGYTNYGRIFAADATPFLTSHVNRATGVFLGDDGWRAVSGSRVESERLTDSGSLRIWDLRNGADLVELPLRGGTYTSDVAPDGQRFAVSRPNSAAVRDARPGAVVTFPGGATLATIGRGFSDAEFDATGQRLWISNRTTDRVGLLDAATGAELASLPHTIVPINTQSPVPAFSPDGTLLVTAGHTPQVQVHLFDGRTGDPVGELSGHRSFVRHFAFGPRGRLLVTSSWDHTARIWDVSDRDDLRLVNVVQHGDAVWWADVGPDGERVVTAASDGAAQITDLRATGARSALLLEEHSGAVRWVGFTPDGTHVVTCSDDCTAMVWDAATGQRRRVLEGHTGAIQDAVFVPDTTRLITRSLDGTVRIWDWQSGAPLVTRVLYSEGNWLAFEPSGHYHGTAQAAEWAQIEANGRFYPLSSYASIFHDPEAVAASLRGEVVRAPPRLPTAPVVEVTEPRSDPATVPDRSFGVDVVVRDDYGVTGIDLTQDGAALPPGQIDPHVERSRVGRGFRARLSLRLGLPDSRTTTTLRVRATNRRGIKSRPHTITVRYEPPTRELYVLALGVADYDDDSLDLKCPLRDVEELTATLQRQRSGFYQRVHVHTLTDREVTAGAINRERSTFLRQAKPEDTIVVFVAGHGVRTDAEEYFFLTSTATPGDPYDGVPRATLERLVTWRGLHARRRVLLLDTCHAGGDAFGATGAGDAGATRGERGPRLYDKKFVDQQSREGVYIMAASKDDELAREIAGNGIFTRALIDGLAGAADAQGHGDGDGVVTIEELKRYAERQVLERSEGRQRPTFPTVLGGEDFALARVAR